jgi:hypothetical protein
LIDVRLRLKCDGTRAETIFHLSAKRTSPFKSAGASVSSTLVSRGVGIRGSNAGYTKFRGSEGYWLPTPFASFPFTSPPVHHRVPSRLNWTLLAKYKLAMPAESTGNTGHDYSRVYDTLDNCSQYFKLLPLVPDDLYPRQTDRQTRNLFYSR